MVTDNLSQWDYDKLSAYRLKEDHTDDVESVLMGVLSQMDKNEDIPSPDYSDQEVNPFRSDDLIRNEDSLDIVNSSDDYDDIVPIEDENKQDDAPPEDFVAETPRENRDKFNIQPLTKKPSKSRLLYANQESQEAEQTTSVKLNNFDEIEAISGEKSSAK